jgi:hypothetical protein
MSASTPTDTVLLPAAPVLEPVVVVDFDELQPAAKKTAQAVAAVATSVSLFLIITAPY